MIICDHPSLFTQCCQRTSHVISLAKSSIKSGQRRSGPGNLSRKARQNFFFLTKLEINHILLLREVKGSRLPYAQSCTLPLCTTGTSTEVIRGTENPWESQTSPWRHSSSHLLSLPKPCWMPVRRHLRFMISGIKKLLGGTTPLAKKYIASTSSLWGGCFS